MSSILSSHLIGQNIDCPEVILVGWDDLGSTNRAKIDFMFEGQMQSPASRPLITRSISCLTQQSLSNKVVEIVLFIKDNYRSMHFV